MSNSRKNTRRTTSDYYIVFDGQTEEILGRVSNMSQGGLKLISEKAVDVPRLFHCRMTLPEPVMGQGEILFDAESRWTREIGHYGWYETGYEFGRISNTDRERLELLLRKWMIEESQKLNATGAATNKSGQLPKIRVIKS